MVIVSAVPAGVRAMAMAVSIFVIHALGDAISPPLIGLLADARGLALAVLIVPAATRGVGCDLDDHGVENIRLKQVLENTIPAAYGPAEAGPYVRKPDRT